jgi:outer membrane protein assembly factor BamB
VPTPLPGIPVPLPEGPVLAWTVDIPAAPITSPFISGDRVFLAHLPGIITAYHRADRRELWRTQLATNLPLAAHDELVLVSSGEAIHALRAADGSEVWRTAVGKPSAPLLVKDGWLIVATADTLTALRASDGATIWTAEAGVQRQRGAISGDVLFIPQVNGHLVARDLLNGKVRWTASLGGIVGEPFVLGDDVFVGAGKVFFCLKADSGEVRWRYRVGADMRGVASSDGDRVFFTALDNLVRAHDRTHGALRWQTGVPFRPLTGPAVSGGSIFMSGPQDQMLKLRAVDGQAAGTLAFPGRMAVSPGSALTEAGIVFAAVTGGLAQTWKLSLSFPLR